MRLPCFYFSLGNGRSGLASRLPLLAWQRVQLQTRPAGTLHAWKVSLLSAWGEAPLLLLQAWEWPVWPPGLPLLAWQGVQLQTRAAGTLRAGLEGFLAFCLG